jgi:8-oxo-dGTP pyrophosphatase MutT (NUDIX family)
LLSFDPNRETSVPRAAATVVVVREGACGSGGSGIEVFCVRRHAKSAFLGGAVVFPGGKVDAGDADEAWLAQATAPDPRAGQFAGPSEEGGAPVPARALAVAACRETLEEARILPLTEPVGETEIEALHAALAAAPGALAAVLAKAGQKLALSALSPFARWITPRAEPRRFDARFFLLECPPGQAGRHDEHETTHSFWERPAIVLDRAARGEIFLAPPTTRSLELLAACADVHTARAVAREQSLHPVCPVFVPAEAPFLALPGDPAHPVADRRVAGPTRFVLRDGRFVSEDPREPAS